MWSENKDEENWEKEDAKVTFILLGIISACCIPLAVLAWYFS